MFLGIGAKRHICWKRKIQRNIDDLLTQKYCISVRAVRSLPCYLSTEENLFLELKKIKLIYVYVLFYIDVKEDRKKVHEINPVSSSATGLPKILVLLAVVKSLSCIWLFVTPRAGAYLAPLSMGFPSQEYWSGLPFLSPGDLPDPGVKPKYPVLADGFSDSVPLSHQGSPVVLLFLEKKKKEEARPERT